MGASDPVILFDGVCNLCNSSVQFVIKRDKNGTYRFAALQSEAANKLLNNFQHHKMDLTTIILVQGNQLWTKSDAALRIAKKLSGAWPLLYAFIVVPRFLRNAVYDWIARNRYQWFGKKDECMIPTPELRQRFLA